MQKIIATVVLVYVSCSFPACHLTILTMPPRREPTERASTPPISLTTVVCFLFTTIECIRRITMLLIHVFEFQMFCTQLHQSVTNPRQPCGPRNTMTTWLLFLIWIQLAVNLITKADKVLHLHRELLQHNHIR